jgi:8-oxo-dGTP pyrophosphatase MutT (NUDIX family)
MVEAAGGLIVRNGRVALVHRPRYDDWSLPKGKLEKGESFKKAALREVEEECNLRCKLLDELPSDTYKVRRGKKIVRWWRMEVVEDLGFKADDEVDELRWLKPTAAAKLVSYDHDRLLIESLPAKRWWQRG